MTGEYEFMLPEDRALKMAEFASPKNWLLLQHSPGPQSQKFCTKGTALAGPMRMAKRKGL